MLLKEVLELLLRASDESPAPAMTAKVTAGTEGVERTDVDWETEIEEEDGGDNDDTTHDDKDRGEGTSALGEGTTAPVTTSAADTATGAVAGRDTSPCAKDAESVRAGVIVRDLVQLLLLLAPLVLLGVFGTRDVRCCCLPCRRVLLMLWLWQLKLS